MDTSVSFYLEALVFSDPDFREDDPNFLSRSERYDQAVRKSAQMILKLREYGIADPEEIFYYKRYVVEKVGSWSQAQKLLGDGPHMVKPTLISDFLILEHEPQN